MLSRVAGSLHLVGGLLERADHLARVLDVHVTLALDRPGGPEKESWSRLLELAGRAHGPDVDFQETVDEIVTGATPPSIHNSISIARRDAISVRPSLSTEVYEAINQLYWDLEEADRLANLHSFCIRVQRGVQLTWGLLDDTMSHDEAWDFLRLGKELERAEAVARLITRKLRWLGTDADPVEWAAALRSCSAFEAYRWRFSAPVTPARVAGFLLLDPTLPRSARHSVAEALGSVRRIDEGRGATAPHRLLGRLNSLLEYTVEAEVASDPAGFTEAFESGMASLREALAATYFRPTSVPSTQPVVTPPVWVHAQQ